MPAWARARAQEDVKAGLCELAEAHGADLLLVGHAHPSRLRKTFTTSTASHLAHYAPCPTLIIPYKHLGLEPAASDALPEGDAGALAAAPSSGGGAGAGVGRRASVGRLDAEQGRRASSARLPPAQPAALRYLRPPRQAAVIRRPRCTAQPQGLSKDAVPVCPVCKRRRFMQCVRAAARCTPGPSRVSWVAAGPQPPSAPRPRLHAQRLNFTTEDDLAYGGSSI